MRLEQENDDLAHELVTSKIALRKDLDNVSHVLGWQGRQGLTPCSFSPWRGEAWRTSCVWDRIPSSTSLLHPANV